MNFTIFLNSRGRVNQLTRFVEAVEKTTSNPHELEVIIRGDVDDLPTLDFFKTLPARPIPIDWNPKVGPRPQSLCGSYNEMARLAQGRYLLVMNDDAELMTQGWDDIALAKIKEYQIQRGIKDDIIYGMTWDNSADKLVYKGFEYASFPILSKQAVDVLGFFMYDEFVGLGGDSSMVKIYRAIDRIIPMEDIKIDHVFHNTTFRVLAPDQTAAEMRANSGNYPNPFNFDVSSAVKVLTDFINKS